MYYDYVHVDSLHHPQFLLHLQLHRRRPFIFIGGVLAAMMLILLPRIGTISQAVEKAFQWHILVGVATVVALTLDLSINVSFNPTRSLIADVTPDGDPRTKGFTWMQTISDNPIMILLLLNLIMLLLGTFMDMGPTIIITTRQRPLMAPRRRMNRRGSCSVRFSFWRSARSSRA